jgi:hypothetical protein
MKQIRKFYLTEFLKTQRYFIPIMILFLQFHKLSYTEIFVLYAVQQAIVFLLEIPSGVVADQFGKKATLIFSRFCVLPAFAIFAVADGFWLFLVAMIFMGINKAFKSGTHKAYIYDYVEQGGVEISFTEVIGAGKFWARLGEALACTAGGAIAGRYGLNMVFIFALGPALVNCINALTYAKIEEKHKVSKLSFKSHFGHVFESLKHIRGNKIVYRIIINAAIFAFCLGASEIFFQPYMKQMAVSVESIGFIYTVVFVFTAFGSRFAHLFEKRFARASIANFVGWVAVIPLLVLGLKSTSTAGVFLFAGIIFMRNVRRPPMITELNRHIQSSNRATILSIDALFRALLALAFLPVIGCVSDIASMHSALLILGGVLVVNQVLFSVPGSAQDKGRTAEA